MAFHCGVLRWLAEMKRLESIEHISTVSGGTLVAGLIFQLSGWSWPGSQRYLTEVSAGIRTLLTTKNVVLQSARLLLLPKWWKYALSRANVLAQGLEDCWGISARLSDLPKAPIWTINGTTAETGRRFRFKNDRCGDYEIGYTSVANFPVTEAMAMSAAFPGLVGPLVIKTDQYNWVKRPSWGAPPNSEAPVVLPYRRLHLYDGGVYDNLALEPLMDPGTQELKSGISYLVCSDAGAPLVRAPPRSAFNPFRLKRILDIALDQTRSLRIRALAKFLERHQGRGAYAQIGACATERIQSYSSARPQIVSELLKYGWLTASEVTLAAGHRTTLWPLTSTEFDRLERHGYESIRWSDLLFA
jgi:NTE family protein